MCFGLSDSSVALRDVAPAVIPTGFLHVRA